MQNITKSKILAACMLMVLFIGFGQANDLPNPLEGDVEQEMYIRGDYPKAGDVFEVVLRVKIKDENTLNKYPKKMVEMGYIISFGARTFDPIMFLTDRETFVPALSSSEWQESSVKLKITESAKTIRILASTRFKVSKGGAPINTTLYLLDSVTGQYGTKEEYDKGLYKSAPELFYQHLSWNH